MQGLRVVLGIGNSAVGSLEVQLQDHSAGVRGRAL